MWRRVLDSDVVHGELCEPQNATSEEDCLVLLLYISELLSIQVTTKEMQKIRHSMYHVHIFSMACLQFRNVTHALEYYLT